MDQGLSHKGQSIFGLLTGYKLALSYCSWPEWLDFVFGTLISWRGLEIKTKNSNFFMELKVSASCSATKEVNCTSNAVWKRENVKLSWLGNCIQLRTLISVDYSILKENSVLSLCCWHLWVGMRSEGELSWDDVTSASVNNYKLLSQFFANLVCKCNNFTVNYWQCNNFYTFVRKFSF